MPEDGNLIFRMLQENNNFHIEIENTRGVEETTRTKTFDVFFDKGQVFGIIGRL